MQVSNSEFISGDLRYLQIWFSCPNCFYVQWTATGNFEVQFFIYFIHLL